MLSETRSTSSTLPVPPERYTYYHDKTKAAFAHYAHLILPLFDFLLLVTLYCIDIRVLFFFSCFISAGINWK